MAADACDAICDVIVAAAPGCDAVMLDLHGAMVAEQTADGEGDLLARVRAALPHAPIAVALDLHANIRQVTSSPRLGGTALKPHFIDAAQAQLKSKINSIQPPS